MAGRFFTSFSQQVETIGVGLYVYEVTRDPLALGLAGLFTFLPQLLFFAFSGHLADTRDRRLIAALCYCLNAFSAFGLLMLVSASVTNVAFIYALIALVGLSRVFAMPANQAMLPNLVPVDERPQAISLNSSISQVAIIAGPSVGGLLYTFGAPTVFMTAFVGHCIAAFAIWSIRAQSLASAGETFTWGRVFEGLHFIRSRQVLFGAISLDLVSVLFAGVTALLPIFATDILNSGPQAFGLLRTSLGVGSLLTALWLTHSPIRRNAGAWMLASVAIFGAAIIAFGFSRALWLSMLCMFICGASDMVSVVIRLSIIQNDTPDHMRGRVGSVNSLFIGASNSLGDFESGLVAGLIGVIPATIIGGALGMLTPLLWFRVFPALAKRDALMSTVERKSAEKI